tara:strand:- start:1795 stop:3426 length:1632 start_codon:yes stop_codon:yes gene_type:complete
MTKDIPSSFCTICTKSCKQELIGFLLSLSLHHPNSNTYIVCDTETKEYIETSTPIPKLNIEWHVILDKYSNYNRNQMERLNIWSDFQMAKSISIEKALDKEDDTLFLDSDTIILDTLYVDNSKQLGVSPQFIKKQHVDRTGYYNGGMLWTNQKSLPEKWRKYTNKSRYYDQASIEDLVKEYSFFEFGENYNLQTWRFFYGIENTQQIASNINIKENEIYYKDKPLKFIHTHFNLQQFKQVNEFFISKLREANRWKELSIIYRVIHNKWVIKIPRQPKNGIWSHSNDSFRELAVLFKIKNNDVEIEYSENTNHCWLGQDILLYDRPTFNWLNNEVTKASLFLLGNGDVETDKQHLLNMGIRNIKPWIFWPRKPIILEKIFDNKGILNWSSRKNESIFIGNFENNIQKKYRNSNDKWEDVVSEYHCTSGSNHKFTQNEYLMKLRNSKFGLCLRGFGSKCHREIELMAFGTVPLITNEVSIDSYYDPPIENKHYIRVNNTDDFKNKIKNISKEKWEKMSKECYEWYKRNVYSQNSWTTLINNILYV